MSEAVKLKSFIQAFRESSAGCRRDCDCGRVFFNPDLSAWTWDEGELDALEADTNATGLPYAVETVAFEGSQYVIDCECWKPRAKKIIAWLIAHDTEIAAFLTSEKARKTAEAERAPVVV